MIILSPYGDRWLGDWNSGVSMIGILVTCGHGCLAAPTYWLSEGVARGSDCGQDPLQLRRSGPRDRTFAQYLIVRDLDGSRARHFTSEVLGGDPESM